ncbi:nitroreductase/quinone reductase family protein [Nocardia higoensis]|uniref:nitroreductase/quinone reductase family protein n=1 Tax=Nocardia higoensis TaxID=228599 RepID=UPI00059482C9|nr:nitroreductase/quinone reductase family protein [Nocardia higoensis]
MAEKDLKMKFSIFFQKRLANPIRSRIPGQELIETTGRKSGRPRTTPIGGRRIGDSYWLVSEFGEKSQYVRNIMADNRVRVRLRGKWHNGIAHLLHDDDPIARLEQLPKANSAGVRAFGTNLLTIRVDLQD